MENILKPIAFLLLGFVIVKIITATGEESYMEGANDGYNMAFDTVNAILKRSSSNDTEVCKLVIINPDTITYYLHAKHL